MTECLFCAVIAGSTPAIVVHADDVAVAFLDTRPVFKGHVLVVPRQHVITLTDLPADRLGPFFTRVQAIAGAVEQGLDAGGTFVAMNNRISQSVAHLHVHVVPRRKGDGLRGFFWPRTTYADSAEAADYADRIRGRIGSWLS
ncbi:histidine triad (HIT) family protein [Allocatelliglobosispora scoriae]|uniref:Histidine triad (HIT) family protein n=1 Tax=Allocatelliglobosispora scoriae TaxID=643052 RepID=A0A841BJN9_9ACTN|nr:HIT family protein [Allocatelliglobosispora scoriae]MBB5869327.1 histidine triad (HIT) family protein [Allocatelliglobosispora scoriae]